MVMPLDCSSCCAWTPVWTGRMGLAGVGITSLVVAARVVRRVTLMTSRVALANLSGRHSKWLRSAAPPPRLWNARAPVPLRASPFRGQYVPSAPRRTPLQAPARETRPRCPAAASLTPPSCRPPPYATRARSRPKRSRFRGSRRYTD